MKHKRIRLALLLIGLLAWLSVAFYGYRQVHADSSSSLTTVTIGYQKGDPVDISRQRGELVKKMKAKGYKVVFKEFQNGAALMTALKAGSIDYARAGDTPPRRLALRSPILPLVLPRNMVRVFWSARILELPR